jgi:iron complex outermembrane receptor protein
LTLLDARRKSGSNDASTVGQLEGDTAAHTIVIQSSFQLPRRFDVNLAYRYVSAVPDQRVPAYGTGDIRIGWLAAKPWEFELVGQNLLQPSHFEYGGLPGPLVAIKRGVYAGITWRH